MKCIKKWVKSEPVVDPIDSNNILTDSCKFYELDAKTVTIPNLDFTANFSLNVEASGPFYGFVAWFDCDFSKGNKNIRLSTSPYYTSTHWKQTVFYIDNPVKVKKGEVIEGEIQVSKAEENPRELNIRILYMLKAEGTGEEEGRAEQVYRIS